MTLVGHFPPERCNHNPFDDDVVACRAAPRDGWALYVHWPFCASKCPYCDFNSHVRDFVDQADYTRALIQEIEHAAAEIGDAPLVSVFFGGGTPSLLAPDRLAMICQVAFRVFSPLADCEVTLEANPGDVDRALLAEFRHAGINRLSIGVQSLDDGWLAWLGRRHDAKTARHAVLSGQAVFDRVSFDLISTRPGQTRAEWRAELRDAIQLAGGHVSVYQLSYEKGTRFGFDHRHGRLQAPSESLAAALYRDTQQAFHAAGFASYEISNFARTMQDRCRHNMHVWRYGALLGVGPGAHGRVMTLPGSAYATMRIRSPEAWREAVARRGEGYLSSEPIEPDSQALEALLLGLRLSEGVDFAWLGELAERRIVLSEAIAELRRARLASVRNKRFFVTRRGRLRLDAVLARLIGA